MRLKERQHKWILPFAIQPEDTLNARWGLRIVRGVRIFECGTLNKRLLWLPGSTVRDDLHREWHR